MGDVESLEAVLSLGVLEERSDDGVENVLHTGVLDGVVGTIVVLVHSFQPPDVLPPS